MMTRDEGDWWKNDFFLSSLFIKALFNFHLPDIFIISTYHTSTTTTTCMEKKNNVIKEMGKNCCNTSVSFFQYYTQHKPSLMSILKKACKKELIKKIYMAWFLIIAATLFPKYLLWRRVQNQEIFFLHHSTV